MGRCACVGGRQVCLKGGWVAVLARGVGKCACVGGG